jgi:glutamate/tyrosine decarboxylase-like PLP-dependent enzyme
MDTRTLLQETAKRAADYLESLQTRPVRPDPSAVNNLSEFHHPLPEHGIESAEIIRRLDELGSAATMGMAGPRFFGFVIGSAIPAALAADWMTSAWDQNSVYLSVTPTTVSLELQATKWIVELLGFPSSTGGAFVTGATVANMVGMFAGRHAVLVREGWNVGDEGLIGAPPITVYAGEELHITMIKAIGMAGLGKKKIVTVPVDLQGRIRADKFPRQLPPRSIVCLQAGNVNSGAIDPIDEICSIVRNSQTNAWVHVDGAFGLWSRIAPSAKHLAVGFEKADSWSVDAHKWMNVPYDCAIALVKDAQMLSDAMVITAPYLPPIEGVRPSPECAPELSRRARATTVWAALMSLGREGFVDLVERNCRFARMFADGLRSAGYLILNDVVLNQVLVQFGDDEQTKRVCAAIVEDGTCWCGTTVWQAKTAMRISVSSWATTEEDVRMSLDSMIRCAKQVGV